jgi:hypothetical protein
MALSFLTLSDLSKEYFGSIHVPIIEVSAKTGENVDYAFYHMAEYLLSKAEER